MNKSSQSLRKALRQLLLTVACICCAAPGRADDFYGYTDENPLVIVVDWDFYPFEFIDSDGQPTGYNVDVLNLIFGKLQIPHKFVTQEWYQATATFEHREADLIHALSSAYKRPPYVMTKNYINYYNLKTARLSDTPPLLRVSDLKEGDTLVLKNNDYAALRISQEIDTKFDIIYHTPKDALTGIRRGVYKYFIWGEAPLEHKIKELNIDSMVLDDINIPAGELRIVGYDKELINLIDDEYARLEQSGELTRIYDKWFHPERMHHDTSPLALLIILGAAIIGVIAFLMSRLITLRVKRTYSHLSDLNAMRETALSVGDYYVIVWDLQTNRFENQYGNMLPEGGLSPKEFLSRTGTGQAKKIHGLNLQLMNGEISQYDIQVSYNRGSGDHPDQREYYGNAILEKEDGKPRYVVYTVKDTTDEVREERLNQELGKKYMKIFYSNTLGMSIYDNQGLLIDLNDKMRELCEMDEERERYFRKVSMFDMPSLKGEYSPDSHEDFNVCNHFLIEDFDISKFLEMRIRPVIDDRGQLVYYIVIARDVSAERDIYQQQHEHDKKLQQANKTISRYESRLRYLLEQSQMFVWRYEADKQKFFFSRSLRDKGYEIGIEDFYKGFTADTPAEVRQEMHNNFIEGKPFNTIHYYRKTALVDHPAWFSISGIPTRHEDGTMKGYFGITRDITQLITAQLKLKEETARAEDSGRMKAAFLANMTHEIRTPLNAIVGFSDILQMVDSPQERMEFIRIIRNNCDMLLRLINDILEASTMGQALAIEPTSCDFSQVFDDICQTLGQRVAEAGVPFVKDNPYPTCPARLDKGRVQQVLTNFVTNAVKYTREGHIKVGYSRRDGGLYFYCEDTGAGIPKEKQAAVFERFVKLNDFVQGTGLGLSICKSIVEKCNGKIGVSSEGEGHGSTFWFWIPQ